MLRRVFQWTTLSQQYECSHCGQSAPQGHQIVHGYGCSVVEFGLAFVSLLAEVYAKAKARK